MGPPGMAPKYLKALADSSVVEIINYFSFNAELAEVKPKSKNPHALLLFKGKGKLAAVHLDARTTQLTAFGREIIIPPFKVKELNPGIKCEKYWTGPGTTAGNLVCK